MTPESGPQGGSSPDGYSNAEAAAIADWIFSEEGIAAGKAALGFARRTGLDISPNYVSAILIAAHEAEEEVRHRKGTGTS